jgi:DNA-binding NtrC family response regulator
MEKILVVEDEQDIRDVLVETLGRWGYETTAVENGKVGLERFRAEKFSLIVTDLRMPVMDGLTMLKTIKKEKPLMPIVVITGFPTVDSAVESLVEGADQYIVKPIHFEDLRVKIQKAFEKKKIQAELESIRTINRILILLIPGWILLGILLSRFF